MKKLSAQQITIAGVILACVLAYLVWNTTLTSIPEGFYTGNGRIEATEIDIATKLAGRIEHILADEGDFVEKGQALAIMQTDVLEAQLYEAEAQKHAAIAAAARAEANIVLRESDRDAAIAIVAQRESELDAGQRRLNRSSKLSKTGAMAIQQFDDDETFVTGAKAAVATAKAQVTVAGAALEAAKADAAGAKANVKAAEATVNRIQADIKDSTLVAPCDGRIQYRISQPGEVLPAGGKVLNLVDLSDVYMTFFLPSAEAGRIKIGNEARIVLDAAPEYPVPATISFVSSVAQFTPKTVETQIEREKLMFRVKAQINRELLLNYIQYVKTGLPGVAWVKASSTAQWPAKLVLNPSIALPKPSAPPHNASSSEGTSPISATAPATNATMPTASIPANGNLDDNGDLDENENLDDNENQVTAPDEERGNETLGGTISFDVAAPPEGETTGATATLPPPAMRNGDHAPLPSGEGAASETGTVKPIISETPSNAKSTRGIRDTDEDKAPSPSHTKAEQ